MRQILVEVKNQSIGLELVNQLQGLSLWSIWRADTGERLRQPWTERVVILGFEKVWSDHTRWALQVYFEMAASVKELVLITWSLDDEARREWVETCKQGGIQAWLVLDPDRPLLWCGSSDRLSSIMEGRLKRGERWILICDDEEQLCKWKGFCRREHIHHAMILSYTEDLKYIDQRELALMKGMANFSRACGPSNHRFYSGLTQTGAYLWTSGEGVSFFNRIMEKMILNLRRRLEWV
jgi:hypothetical protein